MIKILYSKKLNITLIVLAIILGLILIVSTVTKDKNHQNSRQNVLENQIQGSKSEAIQKPSLSMVDVRQTVKVIRVIDGDTIEIEGGQKVRYIGIDTPETVDPRKPVQCFGIEASNKNKELVEGKTVGLEKDVSETDKYDRFLRYIYVGNIFVNDFLVRQGYAHSSTYPPDVKYQDQLTQAEQEARENSRGLWSSCSSSADATSQQVQSQQVPDPNCLIKGNISSSGEKIYHVPGQYYYDKTRIDTSRGERWFCTEEEAQTTGWRKSKK